MTNVTLERTAPTQNAPATYMPQAQGQAADRRIKEKAPVDAPAKMGVRNLDLYYKDFHALKGICLLYTSPSPRDRQKSRMPSSA